MIMQKYVLNVQFLHKNYILSKLLIKKKIYNIPRDIEDPICEALFKRSNYAERSRFLELLTNIDVLKNIITFFKDTDFILDFFTSYANINDSDALEVVRFLINNGAKINLDRAFLESVKLENLDLIKYFLFRGANVNAKDAVDRPALFLAIRANNVEIAKLLLKHGADPNSEWPGTSTVLQAAAYQNNSKIVSALLKGGPILTL